MVLLETNIAKLNKQIGKLRKKVYQIEGKERYERNKQSLGKCFKYQNRYSSGDCWPLYHKIIKVDRYGY